MELKENLKKLRISRGFTQSDVAESLNKWKYSLEATAKMMGLSKTDTISYYAKVGRERVEKEVRWDSM